MIRLVVITYYRLWWLLSFDFSEYPFDGFDIDFYGFNSHRRMWIFGDWLFLQSFLWFVTLKYKGFYTSSKYSNSFTKMIPTLFLIQISFIKPFSNLLVYTNLYLIRMRNLIKQLSKTSGMKRLRLLCRLILRLVWLKSCDNFRVEVYNLFVNI